MSQFTVEAILKATDSTFSKGFGQAENTIGNFDSKIGNVMKNVGKIALAGMAAFGAATGAAAVKGTKDFVGFEKGMNEVFTLLPGMSDKAMGAMEKDVKSFAKEFGTLPEEVVPALYSSLSAGVPQDNVFNFLEVSQKAAIGGVTELDTAVSGIASVVNAYGDDVIDAGQASDLMFSAVKKGTTTFEELSSSLYNVIPTASSLGVEFGDVTAALATITASGTPTSVATTQIRSALVELSKEGGKTSETFKEVSGKSFKDFIAEGGNVQDALQLLEGHAEDTGVGVNDLFSSVEAGSAVLSLTGSGTESFSDNLEEMANSAGATDTAFETMEQGLGRSFEKIQAAMSVMSINIGEKIAPVVADFAERFIEYMPTIEAAVERAMDIAYSAFDKVFNSTLVQSAIDLFKNILDGASDLGNSPIWETISNAFKTLAQAVLDIDLTSLVENIKIGIGAVIEFIDKWTPLIAGILIGIGVFKGLVFVSGVLGAISAAGGILSIVMGGLATVTGFLAGAVAILTSPIFLVAAAIAALVAIGVLLYKNWETVTEKANQLHESVKATVQNMVQAVIAFFVDMDTKLREKVQKMKAAVIEGFKSFDEGARAIVTGMRDKIVALFVAFDTKVRSIVTGLRDKAVNTFNSFDTAVRNTVQRMRDATIQFFVNLHQRVQSTVQNMVTAVVRFFVNLGTNIIQSVLNMITNVINSFVNLGSRAISIVSNMVAILTTSVNNIRNVFTTIFNSLNGIVTGAFRRVVSSVRNGITRAYNAVTGFFSKFKNAGANIVGNIASGITSGIKKVTDAAKNVVGKVRDLLPFSPPKDKSSPLADIHKNGIGEQVATGIYSGQSEIDRAMNEVLGSDAFDMYGNVQLQSSYANETMWRPYDKAPMRSNSQATDNSEVKMLLKQLVNKNQDLYLDGDVLVGTTFDRYDRTGADKTQLVERWGRG